MKKKVDRALLGEIGRFVLVGIICTILDLMMNLLILHLIPKDWGDWRNAVAITLGFLVGVIANYLLSTFFVFRNVKDAKKTKTPLFIFVFIVLGAIGLGLNYAIFYACWGCLKAMPHQYDIDIEFDFSKELWTSAEFWLYLFVFALKTLIVLVYNYLTRKFILYKAPKKTGDQTPSK